MEIKINPNLIDSKDIELLAKINEQLKWREEIKFSANDMLNAYLSGAQSKKEDFNPNAFLHDYMAKKQIKN